MIGENLELECLNNGALIQVGSAAEWDVARTILMHTPTKAELFTGILHPKAALFQCPIDPHRAEQEHKAYIELLTDNGIKVLNVRDVLLQDNDKDENIEALRNLAKSYLQYDTEEIDIINNQIEYKESVIQTVSPEILVDIILTRPQVTLKQTQYNTGFSAKYSMEPLSNLYFLRDQSITTDKGVVISNMHPEQRSSEVELIKFVYKKLGITPLYEVTGSGRVEGGDFMPAGEVSFIGQGLRTNAEAIDQLLQNQVFGTQSVIVVKDQWQNQDQMHLDTYFNIIAPKKCVLVASRLGDDSNMKLHADIYAKNVDGSYSLSRQNVDFVDLLSKELGYQIISVSAEDQMRYGVNFLTIYENRILGIEGVSDEYKVALAQAGVNVTWMNFENLVCGYGAAHCTTQVIYREPMENVIT